MGPFTSLSSPDSSQTTTGATPFYLHLYPSSCSKSNAAPNHVFNLSQHYIQIYRNTIIGIRACNEHRSTLPCSCCAALYLPPYEVDTGNSTTIAVAVALNEHEGIARRLHRASDAFSSMFALCRTKRGRFCQNHTTLSSESRKTRMLLTSSVTSPRAIPIVA